jgi:hypothetical protein
MTDSIPEDQLPPRPPEERVCRCCGQLNGPYTPLDNQGLCGGEWCQRQVDSCK